MEMHGTAELSNTQQLWGYCKHESKRGAIVFNEGAILLDRQTSSLLIQHVELLAEDISICDRALQLQRLLSEACLLMSARACSSSFFVL